MWKWKMLSFSSFETTKLNEIFFVYEVTKPKLMPKLFQSHEAEAEAEALSFWNHEAEAEALVSNAFASWSRTRNLSSFVPMSELNVCYLLYQKGPASMGLVLHQFGPPSDSVWLTETCPSRKRSDQKNKMKNKHPKEPAALLKPLLMVSYQLDKSSIVCACRLDIARWWWVTMATWRVAKQWISNR